MSQRIIVENAKLFIGNISYSVNEEALRELFETVGTVVSVKIITDNFTGKSRGFGFVEMSSADEATKAVEELNDKECGGRNLKVDVARSKDNNRDRSRGPRPGGNGGGADGGFRKRY